METPESRLGNRVTSEILLADLRLLASDAETLLAETASMTGEKVVAMRARAEASLRSAKARIEQMQPIVEERARAAVRASDALVRSNPWAAIGIAAGAGAILGLLIGRR